MCLVRGEGGAFGEQESGFRGDGALQDYAAAGLVCSFGRCRVTKLRLNASLSGVDTLV